MKTWQPPSPRGPCIHTGQALHSTSITEPRSGGHAIGSPSAYDMRSGVEIRRAARAAAHRRDWSSTTSSPSHSEVAAPPETSSSSVGPAIGERARRSARRRSRLPAFWPCGYGSGCAPAADARGRHGRPRAAAQERRVVVRCRPRPPTTRGSELRGGAVIDTNRLLDNAPLRRRAAGPALARASLALTRGDPGTQRGRARGSRCSSTAFFSEPIWMVPSRESPSVD
jgi:hypothetical protein